MQTIEARLQRSYYHRMGFFAVFLSALGAMIAIPGLTQGSLPMALIGVLPVGVAAFLIVREYRRGVATLDLEGIVRRDGKRFFWTELRDVRQVHPRLRSGELGALNHVELHFQEGQARIFPLILENAGEVLQFVKKQTTPKPIEKQPPVPHHTMCSICSQLKDHERGFQKHGYEEEDTFLPKAAGALKTIKEIHPGKNRSPELDQCPECKTYYLYEVVYDYLATGSEDEQILTRLTDEEAARYLEPSQEQKTQNPGSPHER